jgi:hypothetical protein
MWKIRLCFGSSEIQILSFSTHLVFWGGGKQFPLYILHSLYFFVTIFSVDQFACAPNKNMIRLFGKLVFLKGHGIYFVQFLVVPT